MMAEFEEWALFDNVPDESMMLCKFKGRLTPEQMKQDLIFEPAADNEPYRETKVVWWRRGVLSNLDTLLGPTVVSGGTRPFRCFPSGAPATVRRAAPRVSPAPSAPLESP